MSIQYGSTPITDIKYCDPQGTLKSVSSVVRNGTNVWNRTRHKTSDNGVWTCASEGITMPWNSSLNRFKSLDSYSQLIFTDGVGVKYWVFKIINLGIPYDTEADEYATSLNFTYSGGVYHLTWSAS